MNPPLHIAPDLHADLVSIYEEIMWLVERRNITPSAARSWYTHVAAVTLRRRVRRFSGKVSDVAMKSADGASLRLEHFKRIQATLTHLVARHKTGTRDVEEFIRTVIDCEQVHIVTLAENYDAMKAKGDYLRAGISLVNWQDIPIERQRVLWRRVLNGKVSNAAQFAPIGGQA